jgi:signal transduction histidine kinase
VLADPFLVANVTPGAPTVEGQRILLALNILMIAPIVTGLVTYLADRQRAANTAVREANSLVSELNTALESQVTRARLMEREARSADEAKTRFLANMSHELRTPLNAIIGYAEILSEEELQEDHLADVECIERAGHHLLQLINDVLDLSRIEAGQMDVNVESAELGDLVQAAVEAVRPLCDRRGNEIHVEIGVRGPQRIDPRKIKQILINLLSNAAKFTEGGRIDIEARREQNRLLIEIRDTGIGMTEQGLGRVFAPFTQADDSPTREFGGTGLGLYLVRKIARLHGGDVTLTSKLGEGTTVTVEVQVLGERVRAHRAADVH